MSKKIALLLAGGLMLGIAGCGSETQSGGGSAAPPPSTTPTTKAAGGATSTAAAGATSGAPTIKIIEPKEGAVFKKGDPITIKTEISGVKLTPPGAKNNPGEGHNHFWIDGQMRKVVPRTDNTYSGDETMGLSPGVHALQVELEQNDHSSFAPPAKHQINITIQ